MHRIQFLICLLFCFMAFGWAVAELKRPSITADCAECGDGPKDKKCPDGFKCVDAKCVKK